MTPETERAFGRLLQLLRETPGAPVALHESCIRDALEVAECSSVVRCAELLASLGHPAPAAILLNMSRQQLAAAQQRIELDLVELRGVPQ